MYYVNLLCYFVFTTTLTSFTDRHISMLTIATYDRLCAKGTEESYRNEVQLEKLHSIYGRSHMSATIRNSDNNKDKQWAKIIQHMTDDAAIVSMEIHTLLNWT